MDHHRDEHITCAECGTTFVFTAAEADSFASKRLEPPKRCFECRRARRAQRESDPREAAARGQFGGDVNGYRSPMADPGHGSRDEYRAPGFRDSRPQTGNRNGNHAAPHAGPRGDGGRGEYRAPSFGGDTRARAGGGDYRAPSFGGDTRGPRPAGRGPGGPGGGASPGGFRRPQRSGEGGSRPPFGQGARGPQGHDRGPQGGGYDRGPRPGSDHAPRSGSHDRGPRSHQGPAGGHDRGRPHDHAGASHDHAPTSGERGPRRADRPSFPINCAQCGAASEVPFKPQEGREIFCRDCYRAKKEAV